MKSSTMRAFVPGLFSLVLAGACSDASGEGTELTGYGLRNQELTGCSIDNAVPLRGPNESNRVGSNACVAVIPPFLPPWWQYSDGTLRVQIANFDDQDPNENAFPLDVEWENTCGTESGVVTYTQPWQQHELGHPSEDCSIVFRLGGALTEDVLVFWGA